MPAVVSITAVKCRGCAYIFLSPHATQKCVAGPNRRSGGQSCCLFLPRRRGILGVNLSRPNRCSFLFWENILEFPLSVYVLTWLIFWRLFSVLSKPEDRRGEPVPIKILLTNRAEVLDLSPFHVEWGPALKVTQRCRECRMDTNQHEIECRVM